ncbi:unnamed protein product [Durusdinium trenchii]|uniref:Uncharacterized protein n=1 Tax=Durusdinium trenchii TaxID=1381693 RepID=A0ABP0PHF6_9DINO
MHVWTRCLASFWPKSAAFADMEALGMVQLATPEKGSCSMPAMSALRLPCTPEGDAKVSEGDINDSPRLPSDWSPLEYELLEYADSLPLGFAERIARELEGQQQRVAQLRSLNSLMLHVLSCEAPTVAQSVPSTPGRAPDPMAPELRSWKAPAVPKAWQEAKAAQPRCPRTEEASRRLVLASASRQLEMQVLEVRRAAEQELFELAGRARVAEDKSWKLRREQNNEDAFGRKKLWEAEAKLNKQQNRIQQLEVRLRNLKRKTQQRDEEVRQIKDSMAQMQAEITGLRGRRKDFDAAEELEEQLRSQVRELRSGTRTFGKAVELRQASPCRTHALVLGSPSPLRRAGDARRGERG